MASRGWLGLKLHSPESCTWISGKETQKGKMKNPKVKKFKRCENVKSNNRIIQKMRKCKIQKMWKCKIQKMWKCNIQKMWKCKENKRSIWESKKNSSPPSRIDICVHNESKNYKMFNRLICIKNNDNFGFSNAAFIFFTFSHLLDFTFSRLLEFTFSHLLDFTFSHLLDLTYSHLLDNSIIGFYIFTSFAFLIFCTLHFSLLSFLLWIKIEIELIPHLPPPRPLLHLTLHQWRIVSVRKSSILSRGLKDSTYSRGTQVIDLKS